MKKAPPKRKNKKDDDSDNEEEDWSIILNLKRSVLNSYNELLISNIVIARFLSFTFSNFFKLMNRSFFNQNNSLYNDSAEDLFPL